MDARVDARRSPPVVLLVGTHDEMQAMTAIVLEFAGFRAVVVGDGVETFARARAIRPDVIVTDVTSAGFDAWILVDSLKREFETNDIPVIAIGEEGQRGRAEREGCAALITKPYVPTDLIEMVQLLMHPSAADEYFPERPH